MKTEYAYILMFFVLLTSSIFAVENLTLSEAENLAVQYNHDFKSLQENVEVQRAAYHQALALWMPTVDLSAQGGRAHSSYSSGSSYSAGVSLSQVIYSSDVYYGIALQKLVVLEYETALAALRNDLIFNVRKAYHTLLLAQENINVQNENVQLLEDALSLEQRRFELGETTQLQVDYSNLRVVNANSLYQEAKRNLQEKRYDLVKVLGVDLAFEKQLSESMLCFCFELTEA